VTEDLLRPRYDHPSDLLDVEAVPLGQRGLPATTYEVLVRAAARWPDRPAVSVLPDAEHWDSPSVRTFTELLTDVHRVANLLHHLGIRRQDTVALLSPNCDELVTATLAAQLAGVAVPLNGALSVPHLAALLRRSGARVLIAASPDLDPSGLATVCALADLGLVDQVLLLAPTGAPTATSAPFELLNTLAAEHDGEQFCGEPPSASDLAALFHTGGTTGVPKLAAHTHANEVVDAWMVGLGGDLTDTDTLFAALPLFHVNALVVTLLAPLLRGQHVLWAGPLGYRAPSLYGVFWRLVERHRVAAMSAVPTVYSVLAGIPVDADISSLRLAIVGASALPSAVRDAFEGATGVPLLEGYGLTEATCATARSFRNHPRPGWVGQRLPYQHLRTVTVDAHGGWHDTEPGGTGSLLVSGPTVFAGYVVERGPDGLVLDGLGKVRDGWLDTGDLARVDGDGFLRLVGRAKDLIIRGGHNIDPQVVEDALLAHPDVTGAAAVGRPDRHAGEVPVGYVTLAVGAVVDEDALRRWATERVAEPAAAPKEVVILSALPLTTVGKPFKLPLRADAAEREVRRALADVDGVTAITADNEDGTVQVVVTTSVDADSTHVKAILDRYTLQWRLVVQP
jgi:acyl-CoA synthetase (AMP-forming)/AMP-acid ligase II